MILYSLSLWLPIRVLGVCACLAPLACGGGHESKSEGAEGGASGDPGSSAIAGEPEGSRETGGGSYGTAAAANGASGREHSWGAAGAASGGSAGQPGYLTSDPPPASGGATEDDAERGAPSRAGQGSGGAPAPAQGGSSLGAGGASGAAAALAGGSAGDAGPDTWVVSTPVVKLDLLLVVDNSQSMSDKQQLLAEAVPKLVQTLVNPPCMEDGDIVDQPAHGGAPCRTGTRRFKPVGDLHVGVITTSLGGQGGTFCSDADTTSFNPTMADMSHLIGGARDGLETYRGLGFLAWDNRSDSERDPDASNEESQFLEGFADMLAVTGHQGCGFEAPLEAWYRFLVDPAPYASIAPTESGIGVPEGQDDIVLEQRASFLREDSAVAILMLGDENDCSVLSTGYGGLVSTFNRSNTVFHMCRGTTACEANPNDKCCIPCTTSSWPEDCAPKEELCPIGSQLSGDQDASNLRCFDHKRRFGIDLLYPTSRYAVALRSQTICPESSFADWDCHCARANALGIPCEPGTPVPNPLYANPKLRAPNIVVLLGILGVPWQDVVSPEALDDPNLATLLTAEELQTNVPGHDYSYWDLIVGDPTNHVAARDPLMVESISPRSGTHPIIGVALAPPEATSADANPANGHEWNTGGRDLQYACIHPLPDPLDCAAADPGASCDCAPNAVDGVPSLDGVRTASKPLCQGPDGTYGSTQYWGKAYPSLRQLEVLKDYGENAVVSSVCPKSLDAASAVYGYLPAMDALANRLGSIMRP